MADPALLLCSCFPEAVGTGGELWGIGGSSGRPLVQGLVQGPPTVQGLWSRGVPWSRLKGGIPVHVCTSLTDLGGLNWLSNTKCFQVCEGESILKELMERRVGAVMMLEKMGCEGSRRVV